MSYILEALKRAEAQAELERQLQLDAVDPVSVAVAIPVAVAIADSDSVNAATPTSISGRKWPTTPIAIAIVACAIVAASYGIATDWATPSSHNANERTTAAVESIKQQRRAGDSRTESDNLLAPGPAAVTTPETVPTTSTLTAQPLSTKGNPTQLAESVASALSGTSQGNATHASKLREEAAAADIAQQRAVPELALRRAALAEQNAREQALRANAAEQQVAREQALSKIALAEQSAHEQALRASAAEQQVAREQTLRKIALAEQSTREQALRANAAEQQVAREQALRKIALAEQSAREQALRANAAEQQVAREQTLRKIALAEQSAREQALRANTAEQQVAREQALRKIALTARGAGVQVRRTDATEQSVAHEQAAQAQVIRPQATNKLLPLQGATARAETSPFTLVGRVIGIKGPCSFEVRSNDTVFQITLSHIVCPKPGESFAKAARSFATRRVFTREVGLADAQRTGPKTYIGRIIETDGVDLSAELVRSGLAWPLSGRYADEERQARAAKLGIWVN